MSSGSTPALSAFSAVSTANLQPEAVCLAKLDKIYLDLLHATTSQIKQKDELIESFKQSDFVQSGNSLHSARYETLICEICSSIVIRKGADSTWTETQFELPLPRQNKNVDHTQKESVSGFWSIIDMYTFENVGFTHAVDGIKYLTCADCEFGPIGYVDSSTKLCLLAPVRLKVKEE
ncbi:hypothetical protein WR25_11105 [Diploscapter pachys]|uniref:Mss4-like protein n=1 Tax=Diploscapter pachys TaxID=2018661 RepID=A0A2A2L7K7_9BILA|nr:hypothetical protein WR25_11105 [Diploscapter pachys]